MPCACEVIVNWSSLLRQTFAVLLDDLADGNAPERGRGNCQTFEHDGTAPKGMGVAYFQATGANPPNTSKLAAILSWGRLFLQRDILLDR